MKKPTIETVAELIEVGLEMFGVKTVVGSIDEGFSIGNYGMKPI